jgi:hypothetical protein
VFENQVTPDFSPKQEGAKIWGPILAAIVKHDSIPDVPEEGRKPTTGQPTKLAKIRVSCRLKRIGRIACRTD